MDWIHWLDQSAMKSLMYGEDPIMSLCIDDLDYLTYMDQELDELEVRHNALLPWWHEDMLPNDSI